MNVFETLNGLNVNGHTETKTTGGTALTYLSWPWAWAEVKKRFPGASYEVRMTNGLPYVYDPMTGYMVFTTVTIEGVSHGMWLPVMDGSNNAMKSEPYTYKTKYREVRVEAATMFDINKAIMRCLVKNLAMFGVGLYIYAGEDLPEGEAEEKQEAASPKKEEKPDRKQRCSMSEMKQEAVAAPILCADCGCLIATTSFKGRVVTAEQTARVTASRYGRQLCTECAQKAKAAMTAEAGKPEEAKES